MLARLSRTRGFLQLFCSLILLLSLAGQASALSGNWGCLGNITFSQIPRGAIQPTTITISQLMRLSANTNGTILSSSSTIFYGQSGQEICKFPVSGTLTTDATGIGSLTLTFNANISDEDNDLITGFNCSGTFFLGRTAITENFHIVSVKSNTQFYFLGRDDFFSPALSDTSDFPAVTGECTLQ
jgi:hypothetical protein